MYQLKSTFIKTPYRRRVTIDLGENPSMESIANVSNGNEAFVRVRYRIDEENRNSIGEGEIRKILPDAHQIKIEKTIIPKERVRSAGISQVKSLNEKIVKWGETVNVEIPEGVLEKARTLQENIR